MEETISRRGENPLAAIPISKPFLKFTIPSVLSMLVDAALPIGNDRKRKRKEV